MKQEVLDVLKSGLRLEIDNDFEVTEDEIIIRLANETVAKIKIEKA